MSGAGLIRGNAVAIPLRDESVDLVVTSPPYFALRSYRDSCGTCRGQVTDGPQMPGPSAKSTLGGSKANRSGTDPDAVVPPDPDCPECHGSGSGHFAGQIGSEPTPQAFLDALWSVMHECWRVLKPTGVVFVNLGDKRAGSGGHNNANLSRLHQNYGRPETARHGAADDGHRALRRNAPDRYNQAAFGRAKSKMLLPHRFAIGCEDGLADPEGKGWIVRADIVWSKPNGLPESVTDRPRDSHEFWFMLTKEGRYFSAVDEVREPHTDPTDSGRDSFGVQWRNNDATSGNRGNWKERQLNPLGKLPGSVWTIPSEPLRVPDWARERLDLPDHFAAFPQEWPRRLILGWSPPGVCVECGEGRRPVVEKDASGAPRLDHGMGKRHTEEGRETFAGQRPNANGDLRATPWATGVATTITGYACACACPTAPTTPAVILDPFVGTGTVPMVARALGRYGVGVDLSADYLRLARWRTFDSGHAAKAVNRTNREAQGQML